MAKLTRVGKTVSIILGTLNPIFYRLSLDSHAFRPHGSTGPGGDVQAETDPECVRKSPLACKTSLSLKHCTGVSRVGRARSSALARSHVPTASGARSLASLQIARSRWMRGSWHLYHHCYCEAWL